ncbi:ensconsin isoform X4 [Silurus meridionalis]|uniref:ensconsin isoform X4 n=1 Tax=Silurus meridionalis TaxID=175797 RepID=UPI001EEC6C43|nr:ensconsin isoform X4 [Silurus meridionalis]
MCACPAKRALQANECSRRRKKNREGKTSVKMAEGATSLKGLRAQMAAVAQAQAEERRSLAGNNTAPITASATKSHAKPVIDGAVLRVDDKLRVAKERRDEQEKQQAVRGSQILEREHKAKLQVERQMEERQRKLEEQRRKEEQRRAAVEEKRKQKLEEEKEHYEAVMRRTIERSQKVEQRQKRWSWSGLTDSDNRNGESDSGPTSSPVTIVISPASPISKPPRSHTTQVDKRSSSTTNLKQSADPAISKRLSSSAALLNSPDKSAKRRSSSLNRLPSTVPRVSKEAHKQPQVEQTGPVLKKRSSSLSRVGNRAPPTGKPEKPTQVESAHRPLASPLDSSVLSRLLTPTQASLARSKSAAALSANGADETVSSTPLQPSPRGPLRSRSTDRQKTSLSSTSASSDSISNIAQKAEKDKTSPAAKRPPSPSTVPSRHRSPSPGPIGGPTRTPSPGAAKHSPRNRPPSPSGVKQRPPSPQPTSKPPPIQKPALTPTGPPILRKRESKPKDTSPMTALTTQPQDMSTSSPVSSTKPKDDPSLKTTAGTNSAAEAAKILAENRRLAREQKEREEQLRLQREEEERVRKEEEERLAEEERVRRLEEEKVRAEERKREEEEQAQKAEEERERLELEEQQKRTELQKEARNSISITHITETDGCNRCVIFLLIFVLQKLQREEAEAKALEEAEKQRQERERIMQQNQQERMERKKRIEEIMKRTRKMDQNDFKGNDEEGIPDENGDEVNDELNCETTEDQFVASEQETEFVNQSDIQERAMSSEEAQLKSDETLDNMNEQAKVDDKENNNGLSAAQPTAISNSYTKTHLVEGSEFVNQDCNMGMNGKAGSWSFEEFIDLGVHTKGRPLMEPETCNQGLIECGVAPEGPRVAFDDKSAPVNSLHPAQPIEALSGEEL